MDEQEKIYEAGQEVKIGDENPILTQIAANIPLIKLLLPFDSMIAIADNHRFLYCFQGQRVNSNTFRGDLIPVRSGLSQCQQNGEKTVITLPKEIYGVTVKTTSMPIRDQDGVIIGALSMGILGYLYESETIVAESVAMRQVLHTAYKVAQVDSTVMLLGESGTGKEVVARYVHSHSKRSKGPFIAINCAALPEHLIESEMLGYRKGAFTGANTEGKTGLFEAANKGTLFLDEIAELPFAMQSKILRVLETGEIRRLGDVVDRKIDFRLIVATHRDLKQMMTEGAFRTDLFYRLNVIPIRIPPLRERPEDIVMLTRKFQQEFSRKYEIDYELDLEILNSFLKYEWPGNVRELRNEVERRIIIGSKDSYDNWMPNHLVQSDFFNLLGITGNLKDVMRRIEEQYVLSILESCNGKISKAAEKLGISRVALYKKVDHIKDRT
jgi:transcriptional regulator with PAS, ATPase and Fis domain